MADATSWPDVFQLGGAVAIAAGAIRVLWGMERNVVRGYASRITELEKALERSEAETDRWRARFEEEITRRLGSQRDALPEWDPEWRGRQPLSRRAEPQEEQPRAEPYDHDEDEPPGSPEPPKPPEPRHRHRPRNPRS